MPDDYDSHVDYMRWVVGDARERYDRIQDALLSAFDTFVFLERTPIVDFSLMTVRDLADAIRTRPLILKALLACCNVGGRALERDLDIRGVDTYKPTLDSKKAIAIAGYLKPFLPARIPVPALGALDRHFFVDKTIRAKKGRWEKSILAALNSIAVRSFKKRKFTVEGQSFELDGASPKTGRIEFGVDVKRIEARRDIHKRSDEIVNKATKFKKKFPGGKFAAVVYYPFTKEHGNVRKRLDSPNIDAVVFASQSDEHIRAAVGLMLGKLGVNTL